MFKRRVIVILFYLYAECFILFMFESKETYRKLILRYVATRAQNNKSVRTVINIIVKFYFLYQLSKYDLGPYWIPRCVLDYRASFDLHP